MSRDVVHLLKEKTGDRAAPGKRTNTYIAVCGHEHWVGSGNHRPMPDEFTVWDRQITCGSCKLDRRTWRKPTLADAVL